VSAEETAKAVSSGARQVSSLIGVGLDYDTARRRIELEEVRDQLRDRRAVAELAASRGDPASRALAEQLAAEAERNDAEIARIERRIAEIRAASDAEANKPKWLVPTLAVAAVVAIAVIAYTATRKR
jgi:hypothetical protein